VKKSGCVRKDSFPCSVL